LAVPLDKSGAVGLSEHPVRERSPNTEAQTRPAIRFEIMPYTPYVNLLIIFYIRTISRFDSCCFDFSK
jgi:hypothetical protein